LCTWKQTLALIEDTSKKLVEHRTRPSKDSKHHSALPDFERGKGQAKGFNNEQKMGHLGTLLNVPLLHVEFRGLWS